MDSLPIFQQLVHRTGHKGALGNEVLQSSLLVWQVRLGLMGTTYPSHYQNFANQLREFDQFVFNINHSLKTIFKQIVLRKWGIFWFHF
nr:hypothetical protein [Sulfitobacter sp.]